MVQLRSDLLTPALQSGDEVVTVAASSALEDEQSLLEGLKVLEGWGLVCRPQQVSERRWGYLAGKDASRQRDLNPESPAALLACARGGWGAARLLEHKQTWRPGWLMGFSDVTALLWARLAAGFDGCVHGPLLTTLAKEPAWSQARLHDLLFGKPIPDLEGQPWMGGVASGPLVVANLTVASHLLGSSHVPDLKGAILILEDVEEAPYRIDRMLTHWRLTGLLQRLAGLGFGSFEGCEVPEQIPGDQTFQLEEILKERSTDLGIPVVGQLPVGHCCGNAALPLGRQAQLDGNHGRLSLLP
ncbi:putative murein peptide carboxypeptidase [Prochlorococcus marinus str. MIT 1342]|uniref:S66 peptidase family protein n=1 Tax=Prochlorococcus TaxID=1218 RepID=UPI0007B3C05F|nr:LD-carboxypeptidase [Prochlorococcus marinus]KZR81882.1 putative murein peptide carboxypeptidase [Prochlorococcus marinus str. MIT 1342]